MVGLGAVPAIIQLGLLGLLPETPRWLAKNGNTRSARAVLGKVYGGMGSSVEEVLHAIDQEIAEEDAARKLLNVSPSGGGDSWMGLGRLKNALAELVRIGCNRRALIIACWLQGLQQLCGFVRKE